MEYTIHRISLDIHSVKSQATLRVKQADTSRKLHITLCEGGLPYHIASDCYATFSALKADGNYIHNTCLIDGNTIEYAFTEQTTAAVGNMDCEITLYDNKGQRITSPHFTIIVEERVYNGEEIVSSPEANVLDELIDRAEVAVDNAEKVVGSIYHYVENNFANAFKGSMSGAIVQADDVSPVEHIVGCKVRSKNLLDLSHSGFENCTYNNSINGITSNITDDYFCKVWFRYLNDFIIANKGKALTFSTSSPMDSERVISIVIWGTRTSGEIVQEANSLKGAGSVSITIAEDFTSIDYMELRLNRKPMIRITDTESTFANLQLELGNTATEYTPYIDDFGSVKVFRNGEEFSVSPDGTVNGLSSASPSMTITTDNANAIVEIEYNKDSNKVVKGLYDFIVQETFVNTRVSSVTLHANDWEGEASPYSQVVSLTGITENSMVDLTPSVEQLTIFHNKDLAFVTENVGGVVTVYAIGQKPTNNYTMPVAITEVKV